MSSIIGELVTIIIMAFALGMDAFSISLGMGMYRLRFKQMLNIGLIVGIFHILMPLLGMIAGRFCLKNLMQLQVTLAEVYC